MYDPTVFLKQTCVQNMIKRVSDLF